jgi:molybdate transport system substrate-binding protein
VTALGAAVVLLGCSSPTAKVPVEASPVQVFAAGSLREALTEIARDYQARTGQLVTVTFGPSGLLRERIEGGAPAQVFASADTDHPQRLAAQGGWQPPEVFTRNALCALTSEKVSAMPDTLLTTMLRADVRVGASTPKADPSGDYAWAAFRKADSILPGAFAQLDTKALKLTGGANSPKPPAGSNNYAWVMDEGQADLFLTYCTNAVAAMAQSPRLRIVQLPAALQVSADYGVGVRKDASAAAQAFGLALRGPQAQAVLTRLGFAPL